MSSFWNVLISFYFISIQDYIYILWNNLSVINLLGKFHSSLITAALVSKMAHGPLVLKYRCIWITYPVHVLDSTSARLNRVRRCCWFSQLHRILWFIHTYKFCSIWIKDYKKRKGLWFFMRWQCIKGYVHCLYTCISIFGGSKLKVRLTTFTDILCVGGGGGKNFFEDIIVF